MKFFALMPAGLCALGTLSGVFAQNSEAIISDLNRVTQLSAELRVTVQATTFLNATAAAPRIVNGLQNIVATVTRAVADTHASSGSSSRDVITGRAQMKRAITHEACEAIVTALLDFVRVHQALLSVIIGKHGVLSPIGFATPIRLALVAIEKGVDTFAIDIIEAIPCDKTRANQGLDSLDVTLERSIEAYS
ncbi:hypothetical protein GLOTRDRAFT_131013 [Gloeophyllum trabeum ATCC 11539]|uniref:Uncharacterized protein n=1 Tax=Gloeophyllum trabeum (strain ATCC 11539 / FP-39264 / Madison 617) TaxID=670483 RepID=S7Q279_GLOTA|nr:uncharacterized protein GLOTRDRAFT_131013 [Gloeophyllum trabeum ATCC 11539]EPQ53673.1 hypothetical protein GLOTRDRAFT_131013 [Gloeophyllum trabeum ATCC 11539]